ncbi:DUF4345 domain-containing protein [Mycobacterium sp. NPDC050853]|uniref:DUF4345 domain-containing protein n=1 Tax=Mycobacteriaceae TaxID=1762 RepID=UPI0015DEA664|nr:DUF4345 domain-containing protein [Mycobacteroides sp. LB1]
MIIRTLKTLGWIVGLALIALGAGRILFPAATIPGGGAMNATLDSETRAAGALLVAFGAAYVWAVRTSPIPSALLKYLALTMGLLATARVVSMVANGIPHNVFVAAAAIEFAAAALTYWYSTMNNEAPLNR